MPTRSVDPQQLQQNRALRLRIGRQRRRIDARLRNAGRQARRLASWRTYVRHYPGYALGAAMGLGMIASAGLRADRLWGWLGTRLLRGTTEQIGKQLWTELKQVRVRSAPQTEPAGKSAASCRAKNIGADDGRE